MNIDMGTWGIKSPFGETGVSAVLGAEFRRDRLHAVTDENFSTGNAAGQGGPTIGLSGSLDVSEYFGELQIPLIEGQEFAHEVTIDLAYRYSEYDTGVTTDTWKIGADWAPTEDIRFRASRQRAVRAANVIELFFAQGFNLFDMADDPCDFTDPNADGSAGAAACVGVAAWQVTAGQAAGGALTSPAGQYSFLQGGNPNLTPEVGDTTTLGLVFTPTFLKDLIVSVDWFNIEIDKPIGVAGAANTVNACYFGGDAFSCSRILRNPGTGQLWIGAGRVEDLNTNIGFLSTTGIDINAQYRLNLDDLDLDGSGAIKLELIGTLLDELFTDPGAVTGAPSFDCAGLHSGRCGTPNPEWRHRFRATWQTPWDTDLIVTWRKYGQVTGDGLGTGELDYKFDAENYFDLAASVGLPLNTRLRFGVNNIMDNDPPISDNVGTTGNGNTYPQTYEARGRWMFMGLTVDM
jgi:outer membrane receptor protein involved in Fe transport